MSFMERVVLFIERSYKPHKLIEAEGARLLRETLYR
jgi:hypothetical protein